MNDTLVRLTILAYQSYGDSAGQKNYQGNPMPTWEELPEAIKGHWLAAIRAVLKEVE